MHDMYHTHMYIIKVINKLKEANNRWLILLSYRVFIIHGLYWIKAHILQT